MSQHLASFLKAGGVLLVADNIDTRSSEHSSTNEGDTHNESSGPYPTPSDALGDSETHPHSKTPSNVVPHKYGFSHSQMEAAFTFAGFSDFSFTQRVRAKKGKRQADIFVARGVKPPPPD